MIKKNIIANIAGRAWAFLSVYLFVPLYLKFLGVEAYGLVGFYSALLGVLAFADMGFTATLNREMARLSVRNDSDGEMRDLLRTYELTYLFVSIALAISIWILSPLIVTHWLQSSLLQPQEITMAIQLMGVAIAFQLPSGLYIGGLMGLQRQVEANRLQIAWSIYRGLGGVLVLCLLSPTIIAFASWQLVSNALYCFLSRRNLWQTLYFVSTQHVTRFKWQVFRDTWRYGAGMAAMAVVSILLTQTDKLAVSKMLPLDMMGFYTLAGSLAVVPLMMAGPIALAVFPRLAVLVVEGDRLELVRLYHQASRLVALSVIPSGITLAFFAGDFIRAWTGLPATAVKTELTASLLIVGQSMQAVTLIPFYLALAHGDVRLNLKIGVASIILITPLLIYLIARFGIVGAGLSWVIMNVCTLPPYMYFLHRRFMRGEFLTWCIFGIGLPILTALPFVVLGRLFIPYSESRLMTFVIVGFVWLVSTAFSVMISRELRNEFNKLFNQFSIRLHASRNSETINFERK